MQDDVPMRLPAAMRCDISLMSMGPVLQSFSMTVTAWQAPVYSLGYICSTDRAKLQRELSSTAVLDVV